MSETSGADKPAHEETTETSADKKADEINDEAHGGEQAPGDEPAHREEGRSGPPDRRIARILAVLVLLGLPALLFLLSGPDKAKGGGRMQKFAVGKELDLEITLVAADKTSLACASKETVNGHHCAFESANKPFPGGAGDEKTQLRPYNTVDQEPLMITGLWAEPPLAGQLPQQRFSVKCHYKVDGKVSKPQVRWQPNGPWIDEQIDWPTGTVSRCALVVPKPLRRALTPAPLPQGERGFTAVLVPWGSRERSLPSPFMGEGLG